MGKNVSFITSPRSKVKPRNEEFVSVLLFGENHGYRMKSYGPISLMPVEGKTLIEKQVETIKASFNNFEIILCAGFEIEKIVNFVKDNFADINFRVVENQVHYNSNCCESARLCINNTNNTKIILCSGGLLLKPEHFNNINLNKSSIITQKENENLGFDIGVINNLENLESLSVGVKGPKWAEILYLSNKKMVKALYSILSNPEYKNRFMFEAIDKMSFKNSIRIQENILSPIIKINNIKTLRRITKI
jgi:hypothetical protein